MEDQQVVLTESQKMLWRYRLDEYEQEKDQKINSGFEAILRRLYAEKDNAEMNMFFAGLALALSAAVGLSSWLWGGGTFALPSALSIVMILLIVLWNLARRRMAAILFDQTMRDICYAGFKIDWVKAKPHPRPLVEPAVLKSTIRLIRERLKEDPAYWERLNSELEAQPVAATVSSSSSCTFAWTPPGSELGLGSICLREKPKGELTPGAYRAALATRIDRMVSREEPEWARELLRVVERRDNLSIGDLGMVGELLADHSGWLGSRAGMPSFPVPPNELIHEPETLEALIDADESLEDFLGTLYGDCG